MAYRTISPSLIAEALGEDTDIFIMLIRDKHTPEHDAYYEGYLNQMIELKEATIKAAKNGSNPAQLELVKALQSLNREVNG